MGLWPCRGRTAPRARGIAETGEVVACVWSRARKRPTVVARTHRADRGTDDFASTLAEVDAVYVAAPVQEQPAGSARFEPAESDRAYWCAILAESGGSD